MRVVAIFLVLFVPGVLTYIANYDRRTAFAVLYEEDDIWGSIVFHQWSNDTPLIISVLFNNINNDSGDYMNYAIHEEPVHYNLHNKSELCTHTALKDIVSVDGEQIGDLGHRHLKMRGKRFANVEYDEKLSLYEGHPGYIIGKSFVVRQGTSEAHHRCATIYASDLQSQRPGAVPCEHMYYPDCLVGAVESNSTCVFRACDGYRQYWGTVNHSTIMCRQEVTYYPKPDKPLTSRSGTVDCTYGNFTLLRPITADTFL